MTLELILQWLIPLLSGSAGILTSLIVFVKRIAKLNNTLHKEIDNNKKIKNQYEQLQKSVSNIEAKVNHLVEAANGKQESKE